MLALRRHFSTARSLALPFKMPQNSSQLKYMQDIRMDRRKRQADEVPATVYFQVIGNGTPGGPKSLFLFSNHNRYLFNCGEGTQRMCQEFTGSKSLAQLTNIFITKKSWDNIGGLPGMFLSVRGAGSPDIRVHGPDGCMKMHEVTKHFVILHDFALRSHRAEDGVYEDNVLSVRHVPLSGSDLPPVKMSEEIGYGWSRGLDLCKPEGMINVDQTVNAYVLTFKPRPGKLDLQKCLDLGIKPGPLLGILKRGEAITLDDGTVVKSEEVTGEPEPSSSYIIIDCPSADYISGLLQEPYLQSSHPDLVKIDGIFHFSPIDVVRDDRYIQWLNSFPETVGNVMLNERSTGYGASNAALYAAKLNKIAPQVFPRIVLGQETSLSDNPYENIKGRSTQATTDLRFWVRPDKGKVEENPLDPYGRLESELESLPDIHEAISSIQKDCQAALKKDAGKSPYPKVTFLGTGSSIPSICRNVSSILIESKPNNFIFLDCGEGTFLQLLRQFDRNGALNVLKNLKAIYVSHLHPDHHLGLINLVKQRENLFARLGEDPPKLFVVGPKRLADYIVTYHEHFEPILNHLYHIKNEHLLSTSENPQLLYPDVKAELLEVTGLKSIKTCRAFHAPGSFCVALVTADGYKIVYSGDTRPIEGIVQLGKEDQPTDLLIHEATMEHYMIEDCTEKKHTTFTEAIQIAEQMGAANTVLTHFSQRYAKLPVLDELEVKAAERVGIAFDHTVVSPQTVNVIRKTYPALRAMFEKEMYEMETRKDNFRYKRIDSAVATHLGAGSGDSDDCRDPAPKKHKRLIQKLNQK